MQWNSESLKHKIVLDEISVSDHQTGRKNCSYLTQSIMGNSAQQSGQKKGKSEAKWILTLLFHDLCQEHFSWHLGQRQKRRGKSEAKWNVTSTFIRRRVKSGGSVS
jgi:hypothetical protein